MTLKKVAEIANVSVSTASKALNNSFDVSDETRRLVLSVAEECGYFGEKKRISSENKKPSELNIAVVCPEVISPYYSAIIESITVSANKLSHNVVIYNASFDKDKYIKTLVSCFENTQIDAVINLSSFGIDLDSGATPHIAFSREKAAISTVEIDFEGCYRLIKKAKPDWKNAVFASEQFTKSKGESFCKVFSGAKVIAGKGRFEAAGESVAKKLLEEPLPDVVLCAYDEIAFGLIDTLQKNGVSVPKDLEVVGINDVASAKWAFGGLSTLGFNHGAIFDEILTDIATDIKSRTIISRQYRVTPNFIKRNTTK